MVKVCHFNCFFFSFLILTQQTQQVYLFFFLFSGDGMEDGKIFLEDIPVGRIEADEGKLLSSRKREWNLLCRTKGVGG